MTLRHDLFSYILTIMILLIWILLITSNHIDSMKNYFKYSFIFIVKTLFFYFIQQKKIENKLIKFELMLYSSKNNSK